jgi:hypothetical protein
MLKQEIKDAISKGRLDLLIIYHKNGSPWDRDTCAWAAESGHLECLKYLHENGCPWDKKHVLMLH